MIPSTISSPAFISILCFFSLGAFGSLAFNKRETLANLWANGWAVLGSLTGIIFAGIALISRSNISFALPTPFPLLSFTFRIDALSAFFVGLIALIALATSIYAFGYVKHYYQKYNLGTLGFFYNIFIASLILVVTSGNVLFFLIAWEMMSLASYFLVIYEHHEESNIKAGTLYFVMTHIGTAFIILAFLLLYKTTGTLNFAAMHTGLAGATSLIKNLIFLAALIGFGTKAGIIPFHIWLPSAHPAAPSHVSALMSGVMIKTGVYMLIRLYMDILPTPPLWWGLLILLAGAISALLGVLYALSEHDIKRLLAFSSIENIGIILLGLGSALVFLTLGLKMLAILGLITALYHTLNHATFKALLFLGAGAIISATHTRNIEEYGGLIKRMPQTAFFFLMGAMAISALPPLNGFFSEWLTFQTLFQGITSPGLLTPIIFVVSIGALAFTGGLAAACFVKAFGISFLARPRSNAASQALEAGWSLRFGMAILAALTIVFGFFAGIICKILEFVVTPLANLQSAATPTFFNFSLQNVKAGYAIVSLPTIYISLAIVIILVIALVAIISRRQKVTTNLTWDCGTDLTSRMEISATGFSHSIITVFKGILKPTKQTDVEYHDARLRYFPKAGNVKMELLDIYSLYFYEPIKKITLQTAAQIKKIQNGNVNTYILYILVVLIILLTVLTI